MLPRDAELLAFEAGLRTTASARSMIGADRAAGGGAYAATVDVEAPGLESVDSRPSDVLNLMALVDAPIFAALGRLLVTAATRPTNKESMAARGLPADRVTAALIPLPSRDQPRAPATGRS